MPGGSTRGSKLTSRALPACSVSMDARVNVPASMARRSAGQGRVASSRGSDGAPTVSINIHCSGPERIWRTRASKSSLGPDELRGGGGVTGTNDQRTGVRGPDSLTK